MCFTLHEFLNNVQEWDMEQAVLMKHWEDTHTFISRARYCAPYFLVSNLLYFTLDECPAVLYFTVNECTGMLNQKQMLKRIRYFVYCDQVMRIR